MEEIWYLITVCLFYLSKGFNIDLWRFHRAQKDRELRKRMEEMKHPESKQQFVNGAYEEFHD